MVFLIKSEVPCHVGDVVGPGSGAVDHVLRLDRAQLGLNPNHLLCVERVALREDVRDRALLKNLEKLKNNILNFFLK